MLMIWLLFLLAVLGFKSCSIYVLIMVYNFNVNYNAKKSSVMICRAKGDKDLI